MEKDKSPEFWKNSLKTKINGETYLYLNYNKCKQCINTENRTDPEKIKTRKNYVKRNKNKIKERAKEYSKTQRAILNIKRKERYKNDKNLRDKNVERVTKYRKTNIQYALKHKISSQLRKKLKSLKVKSSLLYLGCTIDFLKNYLESQFLPGMTWENHTTDGWHIDHIIPCASFDLTKEEEQYKCFHYTNLMPRWSTTEKAKEFNCEQVGNLNKNDKLLI